MILKPFRVSDYIESSEAKGVVQAINIFNTTLLTLDNKTVFVPNGPLAGHTITNYHTASLRRVDINVGISYSNKVDDARRVILAFLNKNDKIIVEPAPAVFLTNFGESSLDISARVWCKADDYWDVYFWMNEEIKKAFDANSISIPFPQRDVHLISNSPQTEVK